jgi:plasmid stabilization system protein ParE
MGRIGRISGTREAVLQDVPYIIAYRIADKEIAILTVMHTSQKWPLKL